MKWEVRRVHYATYQELADEGYQVTTAPLGRPDFVVARGLTTERAIELADALGFGHSAHPEARA